MADPTFLPGSILSLSSAAADRLLSSGSGDAALLYLYLLRSGGQYQSAGAARALKWEPARADAALSLLHGMGLAQAAPPAPPPAAAGGTRPTGRRGSSPGRGGRWGRTPR